MFNREHSSPDHSMSCSNSCQGNIPFRSIDHCHSSRHVKQNQICGSLIHRLGFLPPPVYVGLNNFSPSHAHFAHFIANTRSKNIHIEYNTAFGCT